MPSARLPAFRPSTAVPFAGAMERSGRALHVGHDNEVEAQLLHHANAFTRDTSHGTIQLRLGHENPFVQEVQGCKT